MKKPTKMQKKVGKVMGEFKAGTLHSGKGGPVVKSRKQAIAIAMSEGRKTAALLALASPALTSRRKRQATRPRATSSWPRKATR